MNRSHGPARWLLTLARHLAPAGDRAWLEDMRHELSFVTGALGRFRWALGGLGLALRLRLARPARTGAAGSVVAAALTVAVLLLVTLPVSLRRPPAGLPPAAVGRDGSSAPEGTVPSALRQTQDADQAAGEAATEEERSQAGGLIDAPSQVDAAGPREAAAAAPTATTAGLDAALADETEPDPTLPFAALETPVPEAGEADAGLGEASLRARDEVPSVVSSLELPAASVRLTVAEAVALQVYRGDRKDAGTLAFDRTVAPGEVVELELPVFITTAAPERVALAADDRPLGMLRDLAPDAGGYLLLPPPERAPETLPGDP